MHTELYCPSLAAVDPVAMIRAIHRAHLQLTALSRDVDCGHFDNAATLDDLAECLKAAGHPGFAA